MRTLIALFVVALAGCATRPPQAVTHHVPQPYMRVVNVTSNRTELQIAVREFVPTTRKQPVIWLAGASHVGEPTYYEALQKHLDGRTLVMFEGIHDGSGTFDPRRLREDPGKADLQFSMANALGLKFQLEAIDYDRKNFRNVDLSIQELGTLMSPPGATPGKPSKELDSLVQMMDGSSFLGALMKTGMKLLGSSPKLQGMTRLMMIEVFGQMKGDFSEFKALPPDMTHLLKVLIENRNQHVVDALKAEIPKRGKSDSISVFYGSGHMPDLETRLVKELNYRPANEIWLTAFSVDLKENGISTREVDVIRGIVAWQMKQLLGSPKSTDNKITPKSN